MRIEQLTPPVASHGEGPVWSGRWQGLRWVDMLAGDVLHLQPDGVVGRVHVGAVAAALRPRRSGGVLVATRDTILVGADWDVLAPLATLDLPSGVRLNEGTCDPDGRFVCGSMAEDLRPAAGSLYLVSETGTTSTVATGIGISNGLAFDATRRRAFYADTMTQRIDTFDYTPAAGLHNRQPWVSIDPDRGRPDGLTVDSEGGVWVALFDAGRVIRFDADGVIDAVVDFPARQVTACTFGGEDLRTLFVTTSRHGLADPEAAAGALFGLDPGVAGLPVLEFAG